MSADRLGLTLLILYPFLLSVSTEGRNFLSIDHRGSSAAGDAPEPTRLRAGRRHALKRGWWDSEKRQKLLQHIKKSPRSVDTERGNGGRPQAVSSSPCPGEELPLWSKLRKFLPSVDTERRNGYNTYRVRPKRSATSWFQFLPLFRE